MNRSLTLSLLVALGLAGPARADAEGQLIALTRDDGSHVSRQFAEQSVPALEDMAEALSLDFVMIDVAEGAPEEIHCVPAIVFANHRGRSVYQGRSTTIERVRNFVSTARVMPQGDRRLERTMLPVARRGRMTIGAPIKIGALSGVRPAEFDEAAFHEAMRASIAQGMRGFDLADRAGFGRTDRLFYIDFYPHRSSDGTLYLGTALFSQFHCHAPLFTRFDDPWTGAWDEREAVIAKAAAELERRINDAIDASELGDGFIALDDVPVVSWSDLGLPLPARPEGASAAVIDIDVPDAWQVDAAAHSERAPILFRFPAPLDSYTGQATDLTGEVTFEGLRLDSMTGVFTVPVRSVTMGESDLDAYLQTAEMLAGRAHPESRFVIESARAEREAVLQFGTLAPVALKGRFSMKGLTIPLEVPVQVELTLGDDGRPRLQLQGSWSINILDPFALEAPDGPEDVRHTLLYTCDVTLAPR